MKAENSYVVIKLFLFLYSIKFVLSKLISVLLIANNLTLLEQLRTVSRTKVIKFSELHFDKISQNYLRISNDKLNER